MTTQQAKKRARELTLGCYWPSRAFPGKPRWGDIIVELLGAADLAIAYRNDQYEAAKLREVASVLSRPGSVGAA